MENLDKEGHFKNTITLALNKNIPWEKLPLILHEMTPTLEETKQLVQVLLDLLQTMQITLEQKPIVAQIPTNESLEDESELPNDVDDELDEGNNHVFESPNDGIGIDFDLESSSDESFKEDETDSKLEDKEQSDTKTQTIQPEEDFESVVSEENLDKSEEITERY